MAAGKSFVGYVESGSPRKQNPWESFTSARKTERNFSEFPSDFTQLPTVSFVIPGLDNDIHDGSVSDGDIWLEVHLSAYAEWAKTHNSLLIVTFDEHDNRAKNHIPTIIYGARVRPGRYTERISHYNVLSTLLAMYGLPTFAKAASRRMIGVRGCGLPGFRARSGSAPTGIASPTSRQGHRGFDERRTVKSMVRLMAWRHPSVGLNGVPDFHMA
jgi:Phosphoesterase family